MIGCIKFVFFLLFSQSRVLDPPMWETVGIRGIPNERIRNDSRIIIGAIYWLFKCFEFLRKPSIPTLPCVVSGDPRSSSSLIMSGRKLWSVAFAPQPSYPTTSPQETLIGAITFAVFASTAFISLPVYAAFLKFRCRVSRRHNAPVVIADAVAAEEERARGQALTRLLREMPVRVVRHEEDASDVLLVDGCSICLGKYEAGERVRVLPRCSHAYHKDCVDPWLILHAEHSCPLCRTLLPMPSPIELVNYMHESHEQFEISL